MTRRRNQLAATLLGLSLAIPASATVINGNSLQNGLDNLAYGNALGTVDADFYDVNTSQLGNDEIWNVTSSAVTSQTILFEFAGFRNANTFGIYDIRNSGNTLQIFSGREGAGSMEITIGLSNTFASILPAGGTGNATFSSPNFGFYLDGPGGTFYSQSNLNAGGADQMIAFQGQGDRYIDAHGFGPSLFSQGEFILAWEDLRYNRTDGDFQDFVVLVSNVRPVPAPSALGLLFIAMLGLGIGRRRA